MTISQPKIHFLDEDGKNMNAFVLKGDEIILASPDSIGGLVCAFFINAKGKSTWGALPLSALTELKFENPPASMFFGEWETGNSVWIDAEDKSDPTAKALIGGSKLKITQGSLPNSVLLLGSSANSASVEQAELNGPNVGSLAANQEQTEGLEVPLKDDTVEFANDVGGSNASPLKAGEFEKEGTICKVRFRILSGQYLIGQDNRNCGGHNVSFTGLYYKKKQPILAP